MKWTECLSDKCYLGGGPVLRLLSNPLPRIFYVPRLRVGLSDAEPQGEFAIQLSVGQEQVTTAIQAFHDALICRIATLVAKANQIQRHGRGQLKAIIVAYPFGELLRQFHMLANVMLQAFHAVVTDYEPQLQRAEAAAELDVPVTIVDDRA